MEKYNVKQSSRMLERAKAVIPRGIFGHYGFSVRAGNPNFFSRASGSRFWDIDGNEYVDMMCAYGPMILGYNHPKVDEAAHKQYERGNTVSLAGSVMVELAEKLVDTVIGMDWVLFGKNGGDATTLSAMIARSATGRDKILKIDDGYHGVTAWMQDSRPGTIEADRESVISIPWDNIEAVENAIKENPDQIACFISSPYDHPVFRDNEMPSPDYWPLVERICRKHGIVLILDDVRAGFRINLGGSHKHFGFKPDLICFGKAIANGYPISALMGTEEMKREAQKVFYTGTQFFNASPMAAAKATIEVLLESDAANLMTDIGNKMNAALGSVAESNGFKLVTSGIPAMPYYRIDGVSTDTHFAWVDECVQRGLYLLGHHNHFVSTAHSSADIERACEIADAAFKAIVENGQISLKTA